MTKTDSDKIMSRGGIITVLQSVFSETRVRDDWDTDIVSIAIMVNGKPLVRHMNKREYPVSFIYEIKDEIIDQITEKLKFSVKVFSKIE